MYKYLIRYCFCFCFFIYSALIFKDIMQKIKNNVNTYLCLLIDLVDIYCYMSV